MNFIEKFLVALDGKMPEPTDYGWFHLMFIGMVLVATVLLCVFAKNAKYKTVRWIIAAVWIVMVVLEVYKQINFSFHYDLETGKTWWDYHWYAFPYQLCSTPLFLLPFVAFCKEGKFRDSIIAFIGTFAMFGGLVTFIYPGDVFISTIGINIQTMFHHGAQIVTGIFLMVHERKRLNIWYFLRGMYVFLIMTAIAFFLNVMAPLFTTETFNMFYIGPHFPCTLPLLGNVVYPNVPYIVFLLIYVLGFIIVGFIFFMAYFGITKLFLKDRSQISFLGKKKVAKDEQKA
ncbi:MAG: YwaF family protein [Clostridia bacterium]|nr:YwaF family protein [Clostridia bacterium]